MPYLLNNCHGYKHSLEYNDPRAFYDLELSGYQSNFEFEKGVKCVVATPDSHGNVKFAWFAYSSERTLRTCFKKKDTPQELMFTFNHWSSKILTQ